MATSPASVASIAAGSLDLLSQSTSGTIAASLEDAWVMAREIVARVGGDPGYVGVTGP